MFHLYFKKWSSYKSKFYPTNSYLQNIDSTSSPKEQILEFGGNFKNIKNSTCASNKEQDYTTT
jgi:hypothetical protein